MPHVSVVIPTFNQSALLLGTLRSVFAQAFTDYEVVVVNDGSTDDTVERLSDLAASEPRLRVINQPNGGIGVARNRGIDEARGDLVALLDHDDLWLPDKLTAQVEFMRLHPECVACTVQWAYSTAPNCCAFDSSRVRGANGMVARPLRWLSVGELLLMSSALMFDRKRAAGLRYGTRRQCIEDVSFQIGLLARGPFGIAGDKVLMIYRIHEYNYSSQAIFYFNGIQFLRDLDKAGELPTTGIVERRDLSAFLAQLGRVASMRQLLGGYRLRGLRVYLRELLYQVCGGRGKFLIAFPLLLLAPRAILRRRWSGRTT